MKQWFAVAALVAAPFMAQAQAPVNVTGSWSSSGDVQGNPVVETCVFAQDADGKITGSCTSEGKKYDTTGSVKDSTVTWKHGGVYQGMEFVITYTGKLGSDGMMTGTMMVDPFGVDGSFSSKKQ